MSRSAMFVVLLLLLIAGVVVFSFPPPNDEEAPRPATEIAIHAAQGDVRLSDYKGKVVVLDLWATWCGPCRASMPGIQQLYREHRKDGLEVIGVAVDSPAGDIPKTLQKLGITYPAGPAIDPAMIKPYAGGGLPRACIIDRKGQIRWVRQGTNDRIANEMRAKVTALLKE